jgi:hypothetical protein
MDCADFEAICKKEGITEFPTVRLYPPFPAPTSDLEIGEKFDIAKLKKAGGRFYTDRSIEITQNNHQTFVDEDPGTPKILLFTNAKKGTPFVYKALSQNFEVSFYFMS